MRQPKPARRFDDMTNHGKMINHSLILEHNKRTSRGQGTHSHTHTQLTRPQNVDTYRVWSIASADKYRNPCRCALSDIIS